jgi:pimeloyl-ACP methyl ester carboxylesterase
MLVLLNMAFLNLHSWDPFIAGMPPEFGYLRHDYRGTGASSFDLAQTPLPDLRVLAGDLIFLMDHVRLKDAILVGSSFGARVALVVALQYPERVRALCLFDSNIRMPPTRAEQEAGQAAARQARMQAGLREPLVQPRWFRHVDQALSGRVFYTAKDISQISFAELEYIEVPTLLATGEFDSNLYESAIIASHIKGAQLVTIPAASHGTVTQRPDIAAAVVTRFLRETINSVA